MAAPMTEPGEVGKMYLAMCSVGKLKGMLSDILEKAASTTHQVQLLNETLHHAVGRKYPASLSYRTAFMKELIKQLDSMGAEITDEVYEAYTACLAESKGTDHLCYRNYTLNGKHFITMRESTSLVSDGTTGLCTWQAAMYLTEWLWENPGIIKNRKVLELGSGLGFTGIACCLNLHQESYIFTDCHDKVLDMLKRNIELNITEGTCHAINPASRDTDHLDQQDKLSNINHKDNKTLHQNTCSAHEPKDCEDEKCSSLNDKPPRSQLCHSWERVTSGGKSLNQWHLKNLSNISVLKLDWEEVSDEELGQIDCNLVLAADVVYDISIIPALVRVLRTILMNSTDCVCYLASTERNPHTMKTFTESLGAASLKIKAIKGPATEVLFYDRSTHISILQVTAGNPT